MYATRCTLWPQALASLSYLYIALLSTYHIRLVLPPSIPLPLFLPELISRRRQATKDSDKLRLIGIFMYIRCAYVSVSVSAVIAVVIAVSIAVAVARVVCRQLRRSCLKK